MNFRSIQRDISIAFSKITQKEIGDLALMLRATLGGMSKALDDVAFNLVFHLSPEKKNSRQINWHIEVYPQMNTWSGLERGFGVYVNDVTPEKSAELLGSCSVGKRRSWSCWHHVK